MHLNKFRLEKLWESPPINPSKVENKPKLSVTDIALLMTALAEKNVVLR